MYNPTIKEQTEIILSLMNEYETIIVPAIAKKEATAHTNFNIWKKKMNNAKAALNTAIDREMLIIEKKIYSELK